MDYSNRIKAVSVSLISVIVVGVGIALLIYSSYSSLAESDRKMVQAYKEYEAVLKPQYELMPDLVEIVRNTTLTEYPEYSETGIADRTTRRCSSYFGGSRGSEPLCLHAGPGYQCG